MSTASARRSHRLASTSTRAALVVGLSLFAACDDGSSTRGPAGPGIATDDADAPRSVQEMFETAAADYDVPLPLLLALGHVETGWQHVEGGDEFDHGTPAVGIMGLRGERVAEAADLAGLDVADVQADAYANIRAAAAWLSDRADAAEIEERGDIGAWADIVAEWSGLPQDWARSAYVYVEVYPRMRDGAIEYDADGDVIAELEPVDVYPNFTVPPPEPALAAGPDYELSVWRPSPNHSSRPSGNAGKRAMIIIHTCEGNYTGCYSWLTNAASGVSAHYVVNSTGSEISQLVNESKKGWHISASYNCALNGNSQCDRNGASSNNFTVGIEHAGFGNQASWDPGLIDASARLVCNIARDNGIPIDDVHVVGHGRLQPHNRTDPGPNWPWEDYLELARQHCGEGQPEPEPEPEPEPDPEQPVPDVPATIVVDNNNANNDGTFAMSAASASWTRTSATAGHYGTDYLYGSYAQVSDAVSFWFYLPQAGNRTIDAQWTSGTNRTTAAKFIAFNAAGVEIGSRTADQTKNGGGWRELGTFAFTAGWNRIALSRWGGGSRVVIADAIRVR
jgi:N-acetyl-anhydromuramyl-L-alanine amidase AmpD